ncbi:hypothetical protein M8J76_012131 [Diaphorina citri]|nr:hypothetical protein M8J76_012131 [Diaphorina citri]
MKYPQFQRIKQPYAQIKLKQPYFSAFGSSSNNRSSSIFGQFKLKQPYFSAFGSSSNNRSSSIFGQFKLKQPYFSAFGSSSNNRSSSIFGQFKLKQPYFSAYKKFRIILFIRTELRPFNVAQMAKTHIKAPLDKMTWRL